MTPVFRRIALAALAVAVFAGVLAAVWFAWWRPVRVTDSQRGFSIRFPREWEVVSDGTKTEVSATRQFSRSEGGGMAFITVDTSPVKDVADAAAYRTWLTGFSSRSFSGFTRLEEGARSVAGTDAAWLMFLHRTVPGDTRMQVWQVFLVRGARGHVISCTAEPHEFERFRRDFEEAVDSFRFE